MRSTSLSARSRSARAGARPPARQAARRSSVRCRSETIHRLRPSHRRSARVSASGRTSFASAEVSRYQILTSALVSAQPGKRFRHGRALVGRQVRVQLPQHLADQAARTRCDPALGDERGVPRRFVQRHHLGDRPPTVGDHNSLTCPHSRQPATRVSSQLSNPDGSHVRHGGTAAGMPAGELQLRHAAGLTSPAAVPVLWLWPIRTRPFDPQSTPRRAAPRCRARSRWRDSNSRPAAYKAAALPTELHRLEDASVSPKPAVGADRNHVGGALAGQLDGQETGSPLSHLGIPLRSIFYKTGAPPLS